MNRVEPIRSLKQISTIKNMLRGQNRQRDLLLFVVGINSALRISDLLSLKVSDFQDAEGTTRAEFAVKEDKTDKWNTVTVNAGIRDAWAEYRAAYPEVVADPQAYVFFNTRTGNTRKPITRQSAHLLVKEWTEAVGLKGDYGCHSLRKTWGYHARVTFGVSLELIMKKLNHSSIANTLFYLCISDQELTDMSEKVSL